MFGSVEFFGVVAIILMLKDGILLNFLFLEEMSYFTDQSFIFY